MFKKIFQKFCVADDGIAAIEMAFIMPLMLLLYFGLVDVTGLISFNRKITAAASVTADLVAQQRTSVLKAAIADTYNATAMIMAPAPATDTHIDVFGFRNVGGTITQIWSTNNGVGPSCGGAISTTGMLPLMVAGNDLVAARTCMTYTPYVATFMGNTILGATSFNVTQTIMVRPRSSLQLTCYTTTVGGTTC
jgi:Flp pilus assembly protein TadG